MTNRRYHMKFKKIISALIVGAFSIASFVGYFPSVNNITANADDTLIGDANNDGNLDIRDSSFISRMLARMKTKELPMSADYNQDGSINIRDAAAIANHLVKTFSNSGMSLDEFINKKTSNHISHNSNRGSLSVCSMEGRPGEIITLAINADCNSLLEAYDFFVTFDPKLEAFETPSYGIDCVTDIGKGYAAIAGYSSFNFASGILPTIDLKIPKDAKEGDTYNVDIPIVNTLAIYEGDDISENISVSGGTITVKGSPMEEPQPLDYKMDTPGIGLSSATGEPGQTVKIGVYVSCNNNFQSLEGVIAWDNKSLIASNIKAIRVKNMGGCTGDIGPGMCSILRHCDVKGALVDGFIASIDFTIPEYAKPGKVYQLNIDSLYSFNAFDGDNIASSVKKYGGTITVVEKNDIISVNGDANNDGKLNVRDAAYIAKMLAMGKTDELPTTSDFNGDGKINVRDAAAIAKYLATGKK